MRRRRTSATFLRRSRLKREKMLDQQRQIVHALTQCRELDSKPVQPVVEIGTELPVCDHLFQIAGGGGDDPNVGLGGQIAAYPLEPLLLQDSQDLALHEGSHVADFIQNSVPPLHC